MFYSMSEATDMLALYIAAEKDLLSNGVSSAINGRNLTMVDLPEIREGRKEWELRVKSEITGTNRPRVSTAVFN